MDAKVNYTVVGTIGIILIAAFVAIIIWMSEDKSDAHYKTYVSYFHQDIGDLNAQSHIRLNGIKIGQVEAISLVKGDMRAVKVTLRIKRKIKVTTDSYTVIKSRGLTGGDYVALKSKTAKGTILTKKSGQPYPVIPTQASLISDVEHTLKGTSVELETLIARVNDLLKQPNREAINNSLKNIDKVTTVIANNSEKINASMASMQTLMKNASTASKDLPKLMKHTVETLESFNVLAKELSTAGESASQTFSKTNTTMQNISDQLVPTAQLLLQQLTRMTSTLNQFGQQLSNNPSMLLRGKYPSPPGPGEK